MSEESPTPDLVELTRRRFEAANHRDLDAAQSFYAPDAVWDAREVSTFEGRAAIRSFWEDWIEAYENFEIEPEEIVDLGNGVVLIALLQTARLAGSSSDVLLREAWVGSWVDGAVARLTTYRDIDEARAAAERLAEERAQADG
jgi:ketosteroid isomerase-like protein